MRLSVRLVSTTLLPAVAYVVLGAPLAAQDPQRTPESAAETQARLARRGAGLLAGTWGVDGLSTPSGGTASNTLFFEGFFRRGLDQHLAMETSVAFWQRSVTVPASGGLGGSSGGKTSVYLVPQFTGIRLYPFTAAGDSFEPFIAGGVGFTIGIADNSGSSGGVFGGGGGMAMIAGIGLSASSGAEWQFSRAFGGTAGVHYTYVQFFEELASQKLYKGLGVKAGLTYRFQY